jgi:hypothetical protein
LTSGTGASGAGDSGCDQSAPNRSWNTLKTIKSPNSPPSMSSFLAKNGERRCGVDSRAGGHVPFPTLQRADRRAVCRRAETRASGRLGALRSLRSTTESGHGRTLRCCCSARGQACCSARSGRALHRAQHTPTHKHLRCRLDLELSGTGKVGRSNSRATATVSLHRMRSVTRTRAAHASGRIVQITCAA